MLPEIDALPAQTLICHPATPAHAVSAIAVSAHFADDGALVLRYRLAAAPAALRLPPPQAPGPADNLWQHTCCEAFIAAVNDPAYQEFNFSPSGQWAAYRFSDYRQRDAAFQPATAPCIELDGSADYLELSARLDAALLPKGRNLQLGLTAVIEAADGSKSYWALRHAAAQPDFHLRQSFALTLPRNTP